MSYEASPPHRCHRCTVIKAMQADYKEQRFADALVAWPVKRKN